MEEVQEPLVDCQEMVCVCACACVCVHVCACACVCMRVRACVRVTDLLPPLKLSSLHFVFRWSSI